MANKFCTEKSKLLYEESQKYIISGCGSAFQKPAYAEYPIAVTHGKGSKLYDVDGNEYIDYIMGFGPTILGHAPESVGRAVSEQAARGSQFSAPTESLVELAKKLTTIIPSAEAVIFQNSGTEVVLYAMRLARAYTGKWKILKFEGHYHGWADEQRVTTDAESVEELGDRNNPTKILHANGQKLNSAEDIIVIPWNDLDYLENTLKAHGSEIAAVIMEPVMVDSGPILPMPGYLQGVRELTKKYNVLLIFDEVITGFRVALGGAQEHFGVTPDISTFAKAITSGYPFGFVCGRKDIMMHLTPAGTFSGNPIGTAAALATLAELEKPGVYERMHYLSSMLADGIRKLGKKHGVKTFARNIAGLTMLYFGFEDDVADLREWLQNADVNFYQRFVQRCEEYGVRFHSRRGRAYLSTAHTEEDIRHTLEIVDQALGELVSE